MTDVIAVPSLGVSSLDLGRRGNTGGLLYFSWQFPGMESPNYRFGRALVALAEAYPGYGRTISIIALQYFLLPQSAD